MTLKEFKPEGVTEIASDCTCAALLDKRMFYAFELAGPQGARYWLFKEKHHRTEDIVKAKRYLKRNFDVVNIQIIKETKKSL